MPDDNKPKIENPLKNGLRQRAVLRLSKEWLSGETSEPPPLVTGIFHGSILTLSKLLLKKKTHSRNCVFVKTLVEFDD